MTLSRYFALPFHFAPLLMVGITALLLALASYAGLFGLPAAFILISWFLKYACMMLGHAAQGRPGAPVLDVETANPLGEMRPWLYAALIAGWLGIVSLIGGLLGAPVATALRLLGLLALPAVIATHEITGSIVEALDPRTAFEMVRRLGRGYVVVLGVAVGCGVIGRWVAWEGSGSPLVFRLAILMWLWLTLFAVLGGVIYERRLEIGYEPEHSPERSAASATSERDRERARFAEQMFHEFRSGSVANAMPSIERRVAASNSPIDEYAWMLERASTWPNPKLANRLASELLASLLAARRNGEALAVVRARVQADPTFRPEPAERLIKVALLARSGGETNLARRLLSDFDARFPNDPARGSAEQLRAMLER